MDSLTDSGLQSGFVLAVVIGAVLLARYLGGSAGLAERVAQVALGLALMMLVFSATTAFHGLSDVLAGEVQAAFESDAEFLDRAAESSQRYSEIGTIHIGLGIIFVALGGVLVRRLSVLTPPLLLGGVLLILLGTPTTSGQVGSLLGAVGSVLGTVGDAGDAREIARFVVLLAGVLLLMGLLYARRERVPSDGGVAEPAAEEPGGGEPN
jgi:hypothetical protein